MRQHPDGTRTVYTRRNGEWIAWRYPVDGRRIEAYGRTEQRALRALAAKIERLNESKPA